MVVFPSSHVSFRGFNDATNFKLDLLRKSMGTPAVQSIPNWYFNPPVVGGKPKQSCLKWLSVKAIMRCILGDFFGVASTTVLLFFIPQNWGRFP